MKKKKVIKMNIYNESISIKSNKIKTEDKEKYERIAFLSSKSLRQRIDTASKNLGITKSMLIRSLVVSYLDEVDIRKNEGG